MIAKLPIPSHNTAVTSAQQYSSITNDKLRLERNEPESWPENDAVNAQEHLAELTTNLQTTSPHTYDDCCLLLDKKHAEYEPACCP